MPGIPYLRAGLRFARTLSFIQYNIMQNIPATQRIETIRTKHPHWCVYGVVWKDGKYAPRTVVMLSARVSAPYVLRKGHTKRFNVTLLARYNTTTSV